MQFAFIICLVLGVIEQAISGPELFPSEQALSVPELFPSEDLFDEADSNDFLDDNDGSSLMSLFPSNVEMGPDDTTFFANNPDSCGSSTLSMIQGRTDACNEASEASEPSMWRLEDVTAETQEAVEEYWCSQNKAQDRGKYPVCAFSYEHTDVELQLDGFLRRSFLSRLFSPKKSWALLTFALETPESWESCQLGKAFCCNLFTSNPSVEAPPDSVSHPRHPSLEC